MHIYYSLRPGKKFYIMDDKGLSMDGLYFALLSAFCLAVPAVMIVMGYFLRRGLPSGLSRYLGYSSFRSRRCEEAREFADRYTGRTMQIVGSAVLAIAVIMIIAAVFDFIPAETLSWFLIAEMAMMVVSLLPTEIALMRRYD
jgi:hypothetical protein